MTDLAAYLIGAKPIETVITGIRPGEKVHEILLSEEEATRTVHGHEGYFALKPMLPELACPVEAPALVGEYSSAGALMSDSELATFLEEKIPDVIGQGYLEA
jgi:UDP-glucose 4-epimerase